MGGIRLRKRAAIGSSSTPRKRGVLRSQGSSRIPYTPKRGQVSRSRHNWINPTIDVIAGYPVVIEGGHDGFSAYVPDLPGCVSTGRTVSEVLRLMGEAIPFHLEGLREDGLPIPPPSKGSIRL